MLSNGFYAFESALHVRGAGRASGGFTALEWNDGTLWSDLYQDANDLFLFAEDVFGGQFALSSGHVVSFDPEIGATERLCETLEDWAGLMLADFEVLTGYPLAREWQLLHGALPPGSRLVPKQPFVLGGDYAARNLYPMEAVQSMQLRAEIVNQIRELPDGTTVQWRMTS